MLVEMRYHSLARKMVTNINRVLFGKQEVVELAVIALLSEGHLLLEDVPGVGKTTLANALAKTLGCSFSRIQFTPDTLPSDVTGVSIYNLKEGVFTFTKGAVMSNIVLADEINRTSPKTQASLLEAMQERQVTVDGNTYPLEAPFMVIATQNPIDFLGTYNLPEAQLDRFLLRLSIGYPSVAEEENMASNYLSGAKEMKIEEVAHKEDILQMQQEVTSVYMAKTVQAYIVSIINATRKNVELTLGASPRATLALIRASQACAYLAGREYVLPDDVQRMVPYVLGHRLVLTASAKVKKLTAETILTSIVNGIKVPVLPE